MNIFRERILFILFAISVVIFLASFIVLIFQIGGFVSPVVLHFDGVRGIDLYGEKIDVWAVWITSLALFIVNIFISNVFYFRERSLTYLFIGFNLLWAILTLVFAGVITSAN